jgi:NAD(P)H-dependent flavin oxidoreductase YrpB (nitropropane dioxygenase family)
VTKLQAEVEDLIAVCNGDARGVIAALIMVNQQLETELAELRAQMAAHPVDEPRPHAVLH